MLPQTRLDANYRRQVGAVRARVLAYAERQWGGLGSYRDADYEMLVAQLVPRVEAGQQRIADLTDAYIRQVSELELKQAVRTGSAIAASTAALRGVDAATVYQRPFNTVYTKLGEGKSLTAAAAAGGARLTDIVGTGLQLSKTHAARDTMSRSRFTAHRRVLTGRENCALCVIASTQRYNRGDLMPIHPGDDCDVKPYFGEDKQVIDRDLLEQTQAAIEQEFGDSDRGARILDGRNERSDYLDLIVANQHSEIGPIIGWRSQHFAGPEVLT
ncbi:hypothetical protein [Arthrobacter sp. SX1312]|uniref:hypothetical protein n=1 Tax=Arthrobacter sp. SX1312 TaxID=2058896 RepID=UPI0011B0BDEA|nr:hypothetical protein [Arthrobacter sp. SX1312]